MPIVRRTDCVPLPMVVCLVIALAMLESRVASCVHCFAQHVSGTTMPIIRSSRVLYSGCCLWYFVLWFSSCRSGVELSVMCPVCRMLQHPAKPNL